MANHAEAIADIDPEATQAALVADPAARLVDVRTRAEWSFVGLPVVRGGAAPVLVEWQRFPDMQVDPAFADRVAAECPDRDAPLFFLCRSGARSLAAAQLMTARGYTQCFNVKDGFEGPVDGDGHRGTVAGWKASGLPWRQA